MRQLSSIKDRPGRQYQGFGTFNKIGNSTWTLIGTPAQATSWSINGGTLSVSSNASLGNGAEAISFNGGILQVTGTTFTSMPRAINWGAAGGGFDIANVNNTFTLTQTLGPGGALTKLGAGTLMLTGANTYTGGTTISAGTLQLGNGGTSGSIAGNVTNNSIFAINRSDAFSFGGVISGSGAFQQNGTGTTTLLAGANTYTGTTNVNAGTLSVTGDIGSAGTPSGAIDVLAGATLNVGATGAINIGANNLTNAGTVTVAAGGSIVNEPHQFWRCEQCGHL